MKPIKHLEMALKLLEEREMKYCDIWDSIIACKDQLQNKIHNIDYVKCSGCKNENNDDALRDCLLCRRMHRDLYEHFT
jgi:hypothetical protein